MKNPFKKKYTPTGYKLTQKGWVATVLLVNRKMSINKLSRICNLEPYVVQSLLVELMDDRYIPVNYDEDSKEWYVT